MSDQHRYKELPATGEDGIMRMVPRTADEPPPTVPETQDEQDERHARLNALCWKLSLGNGYVPTEMRERAILDIQVMIARDKRRAYFR